MLSPPVAVMSMPSRPLGAAPPKANSPPKVLNVVNPLAVPFDLDAVAAVARGHVAERDDAADLGVLGGAVDQDAVAPLATTVALLAPIPKKLAWTVVSSESVIRRPLPPLPLSTL